MIHRFARGTDYGVLLAAIGCLVCLPYFLATKPEGFRAWAVFLVAPVGAAMLFGILAVLFRDLLPSGPPVRGDILLSPLLFGALTTLVAVLVTTTPFALASWLEMLKGALLWRTAPVILQAGAAQAIGVFVLALWGEKRQKART